MILNRSSSSLEAFDAVSLLRSATLMACERQPGGISASAKSRAAGIRNTGVSNSTCGIRSNSLDNATCVSILANASCANNLDSHKTGLTNRNSSLTAVGIISGAVRSCSHFSRFSRRYLSEPLRRFAVVSCLASKSKLQLA
jgi:hypothetical protein